MYTIISTIALSWLTVILVFFGPNHLELSPVMDPNTFIPISAIMSTLIAIVAGFTIATFLGDNIKRTRVTTQTRKLTALPNADGSKGNLFIVADPKFNGNLHYVCCKNDDGSIEFVSLNCFQTNLISEDDSLTEDGLWTITQLQPDASDRRYRWALASNTELRNELRIPAGSISANFGNSVAPCAG